MKPDLWRHWGLTLVQETQQSVYLRHHTGLYVEVVYTKVTPTQSRIKIEAHLALDLTLKVQTLIEGHLHHKIMNRAFDEHFVKWYAILLERFERSSLWDPLIEKGKPHLAPMIPSFTWAHDLRVIQLGQDNGVQVNLHHMIRTPQRHFENLKAFKNLLEYQQD